VEAVGAPAFGFFGSIRHAMRSPKPLRITVTTKMLMWDLPNFQFVRSMANTQPLEGLGERARISASMVRAGSTQLAKKR
jgi:hypothetical protein